jgi:hypothetical protein
MNETLQIWLFGILGAGVVGSFAWQWAHRNDCEAKRIANAERLATLETQMKGVKDEIGDHESGIRGSIHELRNAVSPAVIDYQMRQRGRDGK